MTSRRVERLQKRIARALKGGQSDLVFLESLVKEHPHFFTAYQPQKLGRDGRILQDFHLVFSSPWCRLREVHLGRAGVMLDWTFNVNNLRYAVGARGCVNEHGTFTPTSFCISSGSEDEGSVRFFLDASERVVEATAAEEGLPKPSPKYIIDKSKVSRISCVS
jgi:hypothetical protein